MRLTTSRIAELTTLSTKQRAVRVLYAASLLLLATLFLSTAGLKVTAQQTTPTTSAPSVQGIPASRIPIRVSNLSRVRPLAQYGSGWARQVVWSPDGQTLAAATTHGIWLYTASGSARQDWQKMSDAQPRPLEQFTGTSTSIAFSRNGAYIA